MLRPLAPPASRSRPARLAAAQSAAQPLTASLYKRGTVDQGDSRWLYDYNDWQSWARRFARQITAASFNAQVIADLCGRCDVLVEQRTAGEWEPAADPAFGPTLIEAYANPLQGPDELIRLHAWHYQVAGEMIGTQLDSSFGIEYGIYSVAAVEWDKPAEGFATVKLVPEGKPDKDTAFVVPRVQAVRYWQPDHEWQAYAWSPMASSIDDLKRYRALAKFALKTADSAVAMAGLLWAPGEAFMAPAAVGDPDDDAAPIDAGTATSALEELYYQVAAMRSSQSEDVTSVAPPLFHWDKDLGKPEWVKLGEPLDPNGIAHRREALEDFARGTSLPVTTIVGGGVGDANHWSEWLASRKMFDSGVGPTMDRICHLDLTRSFLWPRALAAGVPQDRLHDIRIGYDPTPVLVKPDNSENALAAYRAGLLDADTTLDECGFSAASKMLAPAEKEWLLQVLSNGNAGRTGGTPIAVSGDNVTELPPAGAGVPMAAAVEPPPFGDTVEQDDPAPSGGERRLLLRLTRLRQQLGTRLLAEAQHAYEHALRQAGVKVKTRARGRASSSRQSSVCSAVDKREPLRAVLAAVGMKEEELLRNAFDTLRHRAHAEFTLYQERVLAVTEQFPDLAVPFDADAAVDYLVACLTSAVRTRLLDGEAAVLAAAAPRMVPSRRRAPSGGFDLPGLPDPDELSQAAARFTRNALRVHEGTAAVRYPATPDHLPSVEATIEPQVEERLAAELRVTPIWTWQHGFHGEPMTVFEPHADLDGVSTTDRDGDPNFANLEPWPDGEMFFPGDHDGCMCEWVPEVPDDAARDEPTPGRHQSTAEVLRAARERGAGREVADTPGSGLFPEADAAVEAVEQSGAFSAQAFTGSDRELLGAMRGEVSDMVDLIGEGSLSERELTGMQMTQHALDTPTTFGDAGHAIALRGEDDLLAGAIGTVDISAAEQIEAWEAAGIESPSVEPVAYVDYLGSTHMQPGAGTELVREAARAAAERGQALQGTPTSDALPFWRDKIGWREDPFDVGSDWWGWTVDETKRFAETGAL